ncbi:MAG: hypothetical protein HY047_14825 [Acidobacteria bacterium]|nr:hypothetical protein [Acidobacteriota bacterium]
MRLQISAFRFQSGGALVAVALLAGAARAEVIDRVLAVVAGQPITMSDVTGARDLGFQLADNAPDPLRAILSKLIDRELMRAEVERYGPPEPTADAVDREVARVRNRFASPAAFDAAAARSGVDDKHLRETVRQNLRIDAYLNQRFTAAGDRRQALIDEWVAGLRRRGNVLDLYLPRR